MKKIFFLISIGLLISCDDDDNNQLNNALNGKWEMTEFDIYSPENIEINENEIVWTFELDNNKLIVENIIESEYPYILQSGIYDIQYTNNTIKIQSTTFDYSVENNVLTISNNPELDGPLMRFKPD